MHVLKHLILAGTLLTATEALANHPVLVEGNCLNPPAGNPGPTVPGACGDYDGDGKIGTAEDADGDRVFGTITAALGPGSANTGANHNGAVLIVSSGIFAEALSIQAASGNVSIEAAPGVVAAVDAVLQGDPGSGGRQALAGITVDSGENRKVVLRNLLIRNWTSGIRVTGKSRVAIEQCRIENNVNYGVEAVDESRVKIDQSTVSATGFRVNPTASFPSKQNKPAPGIGIGFSGRASGAVYRTEVSGSFAQGIADWSKGRVSVKDVYLFDNGPERRH